MKIKSVDAYQIFDSRGFPTIEVELTLADGSVGRGLVPSGASTGQFEALELRDGNTESYRGKSVFRAIENVKEDIARSIVGRDGYNQRSLDELLIELDGTENKERLGANAILGVSMAVAKAAARSQDLALYEYLGNGEGNLIPLPEIQLIGGGAHANWRTDIQDYLLIAIGARSYEESLEIIHNVYHAAGDVLRAKGNFYGIADEGGYWPEFDSNEAVFDVIVEAIRKAGYLPGRDVAISLDIAASDLYDNESETYGFRLDNRRFQRSEFADFIISWCKKYPIISIEDPAADTDWKSWRKIHDAVGDKVQIIGDDLFTTNLKRIQEGIDRGVANSVLIKLNQIGTVTETLDAVKATQAAGWLPVISARSGETEDAFIAHLAVATNAGQLKVGSFARSERMVKWNECLRIARRLGKNKRFIGSAIYNTLSNT